MRLGMQGGTGSLRLRTSFQSIFAFVKNTCCLISSASPLPEPKRFRGFRFNNYQGQEQTALTATRRDLDSSDRNLGSYSGPYSMFWYNYSLNGLDVLDSLTYYLSNTAGFLRAFHTGGLPEGTNLLTCRGLIASASQVTSRQVIRRSFVPRCC